MQKKESVRIHDGARKAARLFGVVQRNLRSSLIKGPYLLKQEMCQVGVFARFSILTVNTGVCAPLKMLTVTVTLRFSKCWKLSKPSCFMKERGWKPQMDEAERLCHGTSSLPVISWTRLVFVRGWGEASAMNPKRQDPLWDASGLILHN